MMCNALDRFPQVQGTGGEVHFSNDLGKRLRIEESPTFGTTD